MISQAAIDGNFTFNGGTVSDGTYTGNWIDTSNLVITILTAGTAPVIDTTTVIPKAGNTIGVSGEGAGANNAHTLAITASSALTGDFGIIAVTTSSGGSNNYGCWGDY